MLKAILVSCLLLSFCLCITAQPYTISTIAGTDRVLNGSPAASVPLRSPQAITLDPAGNLYIADADDARIRKVSSAGIITTVAGTGVPGFSGDRGQANVAQIDDPGGLAIDAKNNLYFADRGNLRVRRVSPDGTINTVAGNGSFGSLGDGGPALAASITPNGIAIDAQGNLYIGDLYHYRIRRIDTSGIITTIAGSGQLGYGGDNGPGANAIIGLTGSLAVDSKSNVYFSDITAAVVRKVDPTGFISPFAGSGQRGYINDGIGATQELMLPTGLAFDNAGDLFIADINLNRIIKIDTSMIATTVAGSESAGFSGDGGLPLNAQLNLPNGLAVDSLGGIYVADELNQRIRKIYQLTINTVVGTNNRDGGPATAAFLAAPDGIAISTSNTLAVADSGNRVVRRFTPGGAISGIGQLYSYPNGVAFDAAGNLFVTDDEPYLLKITPDGVTSIVAGNGLTGFSGDGGAGASASLDTPEGVAVDSEGNIYLADFNNERIRKITASTGVISTIAGTGKIAASGDMGPALSASLDPIDLVLDSKDDVYVADQMNHRIRKITPDGTITTVAGTGTPGYAGDGGPATAALLNAPSGVAVDANGNLYIADSLNSVVRRVTPGGLITTIAGNGTSSPESGDGGSAILAQLDPWKLAVDAAGNVYISDLENNRIRMLQPRTVTPADVAISAGNSQSATAGMPLPFPITVKVTDSTGAPLSGVIVSYLVNPQSAATLSNPTAITLPDGTASLRVTLNSAPGPLTVAASVSGLAPLTFNLTSVAPVSSTAPAISAGGVVSAGLSTPAVTSVSPNAIATIFGVNFAPAGTARGVVKGDLVNGALPTILAGVCVLVGKLPAPIFSVYPGQINIQIPSEGAGATTVEVKTQCGTPQEQTSVTAPLTVQSASPEFFYFVHNPDGRNPVAALNAVTAAYVGAPGLIPGVAFTPARAKDVLTLFGTGFGATNPPYGAGQLPAAAAEITQSISVTVGGIALTPAEILYAGVTQNAGLYQLNIQVPPGIPDGDQAVVVTIGGFSSPAGAYITIKN